MADGMHQVGLAQPHASIQEQGVIGLAGILGHGLTGGMGIVVGGAHHKGIKGIFMVQGIFAGISHRLLLQKVPAIVGQAGQKTDYLRVGPDDAFCKQFAVQFIDGVPGGHIRALQNQHPVLDDQGLQHIYPFVHGDSSYLLTHIGAHH